MALFEHGDVSIQVDEDGFMEEPDQWTKEVAIALATTEGVEEMTDEHWQLVDYLRDYYAKFGIAPMIRKLCKETGFPLKKVYERKHPDFDEHQHLWQYTAEQQRLGNIRHSGLRNDYWHRWRRNRRCVGR